LELTESTWYPGYEELRPMREVSRPPVPEYDARPSVWMSEEQGRAVKAFVREGGGALFYHNATYIGKENEDFREVLGAATLGHPPIRPHRLRIARNDHPITQCVNDFVVTDEQHYLTYDGDPASVFLESVNDDGLVHENCGTACEAGWAHHFGEGRVCYLAPGHTIPALWNPEYVKLQQNAANWLLERR
jgi:type 1 glutamine amidotransferase